MTSTGIRKRPGMAFALSTIALTVAAFVAGAVPVSAGSGTGEYAEQMAFAATESALRLTRGLSALQAASGLRYQCMQDFRRCTRGIAVNSSWTSTLAQQVFDAEYSSCCYEAGLCGDFLATIGDRAIVADYRSDIDSACASVNASDALPAVVEARRQGAVQ